MLDVIERNGHRKKTRGGIREHWTGGNAIAECRDGD